MSRCDCKDCKGLPYAEVYYTDGTDKRRWSYLCRKHFKEEYKKHGDEYGWCILPLRDRFKAVLGLIP